MENRWFNVVVLLFWLASMSWLVTAKVLPPLRVGNPPSYRSLYSLETDEHEPIQWAIYWDNRYKGYASTNIIRTQTGVTEVHSHIHFNSLPVLEMSPVWVRAILPSSIRNNEHLSMDAISQLDIDPLGKLSAFRSTIRASGAADAVSIRGSVKGNRLKGAVELGSGIRQEFDRILPDGALVGDELSPQSSMPGLQVGQSWTVPTYSPLRLQDKDSVLEVLQAKVETEETITINDRTVKALKVVYRLDSGSMFGAARTPRAELWVDSEGRVVQQVTQLFQSHKLRFERVSAERIAQLERPDEPLESEPQPGSFKDAWRKFQSLTFPPSGDAPPPPGSEADDGPFGAGSNFDGQNGEDPGYDDLIDPELLEPADAQRPSPKPPYRKSGQPPH